MHCGSQWLVLRTGRLDPGRLSPGLKTFPSVAFFQGMVDLISGKWLSEHQHEINHVSIAVTYSLSTQPCLSFHMK